MTSVKKIQKLENDRREVLRVFEQQCQHKDREIRRIERAITQE